MNAFWAILLVPVLELVAMFSAFVTGVGSVWNLGHLLGMLFGVAAVLLLPERVSMPARARLESQ